MFAEPKILPTHNDWCPTTSRPQADLWETERHPVQSGLVQSNPVKTIPRDRGQHERLATTALLPNRETARPRHCTTNLSKTHSEHQAAATACQLLDRLVISRTPDQTRQIGTERSLPRELLQIGGGSIYTKNKVQVGLPTQPRTRWKVEAGSTRVRGLVGSRRIGP